MQTSVSKTEENGRGRIRKTYPCLNTHSAPLRGAGANFYSICLSNPVLELGWVSVCVLANIYKSYFSSYPYAVQFKCKKIQTHLKLPCRQGPDSRSEQRKPAVIVEQIRQLGQQLSSIYHYSQGSASHFHQ